MKSKLLLTCAALLFCTCFLHGQSQASKVVNSGENSHSGWGQHPWQGKKVGYIGDSITDPNCYGNKIKKYWDFLQEWLGITPYVYGISGRQWNDVPRQAEQLMKEHGEMKKMETRKKRTPVMDSNTYKGRINIGITRMKQLFPDKQIILLTPLHRAFANFGETNVQPDENYQNSCGEYVDAYVQAVKEAGNLWGLPVIDFNSVTGMNPMIEEQLIYFYDSGFDRLHPNTKGQERMARTLMYQLLALPV